MEASERPSKIRKLSHDKQELLNQLPDLYQRPAHATTSSNKEDTDSVAATEPTASDLSNIPDPNQDKSLSKVDNELDEPIETVQHLSKKQLKKLRKKQEWEDGREDRKAKRREKTKERKERKREQRQQEREQGIANGEPVPRPPKPRKQRSVQLPITFLIDCGFDDKMMDRERISLGSQLTRAYSDNSRAPYRANLVISSWGGLLKERFDTVLSAQYRHWKGVRFHEDDFVQAAEDAKETMAGKQGGKMAGVFKQYASERNTDSAHMPNTDDASNPDNSTGDPPSASDQINDPEQHEDESSDLTNPPLEPTISESTISQQPPPAPLPSPEIIYLTSDSPNTLTQLNPYSTYIIGGIVDKNRHKGLCYKLACDRGIKTAKLPIGQYMEMQSRFVLATNHVVEIMVRWLECGDWGESFMRVMPKRKGAKLRGSGVDEDEGKGDEGRGDGSEDEGIAASSDSDQVDSWILDVEPAAST